RASETIPSPLHYCRRSRKHTSGEALEMINLMPDDMKKQLRAARMNVILIRYITVVVVSSAFVGLVVWGSYLLLGQINTSAQTLIEANDTKASVYDETRQQVDAL